MPACNFTLNGTELEIVNEFKYLGSFTSQLSFTSHLESLNSKAASKCGFVLSKLKSYNVPINVVLDLFNCYALPTYRYGLALWHGKCSENSITAMNAVFTKYLKRYLGLPYQANNAICHQVTNTQPLNNTLESLIPSSFSSLRFPEALNGLKLTINENKYETNAYNPVTHVPTFFWRSKSYAAIPTYYRSRRTLCREIFDFTHYDICINAKFHVNPSCDCRCGTCGEEASHYHQYFCDANT